MEKEFSLQEAREIGDIIGIDWNEVDLNEFRMGLDVELEHGSEFGDIANVTDDDPIATGRIALAHLYEFPDYYTRLIQMEESAFRSLAMFLM